jgi:hypothetical protein
MGVEEIGDESEVELWVSGDQGRRGQELAAA